MLFYDDLSILYEVLRLLTTLDEKKFFYLCSRLCFYSFRVRLMIFDLTLQQK